MKKGFDRLRSADHLRGAAIAGVMGLGMIGGGTVRASTYVTSKPGYAITFSRLVPTNTVTASPKDLLLGYWLGVGNSIPYWSDLSTSGGFAHQAASAGTNPSAPQAFGIVDGHSVANFTTASANWTSKQTAAYFNGLSLAVDGVLFTAPAPDVIVSRDAVTDQVIKVESSAAPIAVTGGISAKVEYFFHPSDMSIRAVYTLRNDNPTGVNPSALIVGRFGANFSTTVIGSSDGNQAIDAGDMWFAVNDNPDPATNNGEPVYTPAVAHSLMGVNAPVTPVHTLLPDWETGNGGHYGFRYDLTLGPTQEVRIMVLNSLSYSNAEALADGAGFTTLGKVQAAGLLQDMTAYEINTLVNFSSADGDADGVYDTDDNCVAIANADQADANGNGVGDACDSSAAVSAGGGGGGSFGIPGLLALLGGRWLARRRTRR